MAGDPCDEGRAPLMVFLELSLQVILLLLRETAHAAKSHFRSSAIVQPVVNFLAVDAQLERQKRDLGLGPVVVLLELRLEALGLLISEAMPICALCFPLQL